MMTEDSINVAIQTYDPVEIPLVPIKLVNSKIFNKCSIVEEKDLAEATKIGLSMLAFVKDNNFLCLTANQIGYDKQVCVVRDNEGLDIYINPEMTISKIEDGVVSISQEMVEYPAILQSFPRKRVLVDVADRIHINAFSVGVDDRTIFTASDNLAKIWQVAMYVLGGVYQEDVVDSDFQTIRGTEKKRPNDKCSGCGRKNKKCLCPVPDSGRVATPCVL